MRIGSLFAGIGGFDLGFEQSGMTVSYQVENNEYANKVLKLRFPTVERLGDIRECRDLPKVDLLCGGFPCTDLSQANNYRKGLGGVQSSLWWEYHRLLRETRPRWCVIENVLGLLSSNKGQDMGTLLWSLGEIGYWWAYRVLDAQFFGLAQRRKRVFIVGCLEPGRAAKVLLESESSQGHSKKSKRPGKSSTQTVEGSFGDDPPIVYDEVQITHKENRSNPKPGDPSPTLTKTSRPIVINARQDPITNDKPVLDTCGFSNAFLLDKRVRRLTPVECERLQGFPDDWTGVVKQETHRYKLIGNAVAVPVVKWIGKRICSLEKSK